MEQVYPYFWVSKESASAVGATITDHTGSVTFAAAYCFQSALEELNLAVQNRPQVSWKPYWENEAA